VTAENVIQGIEVSLAENPDSWKILDAAYDKLVPGIDGLLAVPGNPRMLVYASPQARVAVDLTYMPERVTVLVHGSQIRASEESLARLAGFVERWLCAIAVQHLIPFPVAPAPAVVITEDTKLQIHDLSKPRLVELVTHFPLHRPGQSGGARIKRVISTDFQSGLISNGDSVRSAAGHLRLRDHHCPGGRLEPQE
jgi:hypothetical protein